MLSVTFSYANYLLQKDWMVSGPGSNKVYPGNQMLTCWKWIVLMLVDSGDGGISFMAHFLKRTQYDANFQVHSCISCLYCDMFTWFHFQKGLYFSHTACATAPLFICSSSNQMCDLLTKPCLSCLFAECPYFLYLLWK